MVLKYCKISGGNFGDDLNTLLWPKLFPDLNDLKGHLLFYSIGTLLDGSHAPVMRRVVLGAGLGEKGQAA